MSAKNPLQGKWKVECQTVTDDGGWETFQKFKTYSGECVWSFQTESSFLYKDPDEEVHHGKLTEYFGYECSVAEYGYLKNTRRLHIERRNRNDDGVIQLHFKDILSVEPAGQDKFILYELRHGNDEPDDHLCRLILSSIR